MEYSIIVKGIWRGAHVTYGVFVAVPGQPDELLQGGYRHPFRAEDARREWERDILNNEVEQAERAAGWDPHP